MPHANLNGIKLYYEEHGRGDPLVLIAGLSCDVLHWAEILTPLADDYRVVIFDNRGVGQTDSPDTPFTIELMAHDTLALMDHLSIASTHILGHSMGGCIAQEIAHHHPQRVNKLVLSNTLIKMNNVSAMAQSSLLHLWQDGVSLQRQIEAALPWLFSNDFLESEGIVKTIVDAIASNPHPQTLVGKKRQLEALLAFDSSGWHSQINVPTFVVYGDEDILCPHDSEELARTISSASAICMPRMAHIPMIEKPSEFCRLVKDFLA